MTLYRETPCEHGIFDDDPDQLVQEHFQDCPGGSRKEVTIDYAAAFQTWWRHDHIQNDQRRLVIAIDTALHIEKEPVL